MVVAFFLPVTQIHAHLGRHSEEPGDEVIGLEDPVLVHQLNEDDECLAAVLSGITAMICIDPLAEKILGLL